MKLSSVTDDNELEKTTFRIKKWQQYRENWGEYKLREHEEIVAYRKRKKFDPYEMKFTKASKNGISDLVATEFLREAYQQNQSRRVIVNISPSHVLDIPIKKRIKQDLDIDNYDWEEFSRKGLPDILWFSQDDYGFIEVKSGGTELSDAQEKWMKKWGEKVNYELLVLEELK